MLKEKNETRFKKVDNRNIFFDPDWIKELNEWDGHLIVISGPSGVGKTTIAEELNYPVLHSVTTRERRDAFENYDFWSNEEFDKVEQQNGFLTKITYGENRYGVTKEEWKRVSKGQKVVVAVMSPSGYKILKKQCPKVIGVFLTAPKKLVFERIKQRDGKVESGRKKSFANNHKSKGFYHIVASNIYSKKRVSLLLKCKLWMYRSCYKVAGERVTTYFFPTSKKNTNTNIIQDTTLQETSKVA